MHDWQTICMMMRPGKSQKCFERPGRSQRAVFQNLENDAKTNSKPIAIISAEVIRCSRTRTDVPELDVADYS